MLASSFYSWYRLSSWLALSFFSNQTSFNLYYFLTQNIVTLEVRIIWIWWAHHSEKKLAFLEGSKHTQKITVWWKSNKNGIFFKWSKNLSYLLQAIFSVIHGSSVEETPFIIKDCVKIKAEVMDIRLKQWCQCNSHRDQKYPINTFFLPRSAQAKLRSLTLTFFLPLVALCLLVFSSDCQIGKNLRCHLLLLVTAGCHCVVWVHF